MLYDFFGILFWKHDMHAPMVGFRVNVCEFPPDHEGLLIALDAFVKNESPCTRDGNQTVLVLNLR